jgi:Cof subfamily protein (haloacid dehalogenase superfamily)
VSETAPKDIRLLLSDVDGTLVTKDKVLTEAARAAARELGEAGVALALTSSRPPLGMRMLIEPLGMRQPVAGFNGGVLVNPDMTVIETRPIDPLAAKQIVDFLLKQGLDVWVYTEADWYVRDPDTPRARREAWIVKFEPVVVPAFTIGHLARAIKIVGVSDDHDLIAASEAAAQALLGDAASATRSSAYFLDVTNPGANKGAVVETLARRLGIAPAQIATIGDMPNDLLMFAKCGFSIAMGNASDAVKAKANAVTDSNEDDGFAKAVRRFILPAAAR